MAIKFIGKQRTLSGFIESPIAQLINVPQVQGYQRCQYCIYWEQDRFVSDIDNCIIKNKCGYESLLWARLTNGYPGSNINSKHFTPTNIIRQRKLSETPRYLQYFTCDLDGYVCNRLCQFYPQRIQNEQSVAECANSNNCGQNGSFFRLLELVRQDVTNLTQFFGVSVPAPYILQWDGRLVTITGGGTWNWNEEDDYEYTDPNGVKHRILLMFQWSPNSGCFLHRNGDNPDLYLFNRPAVALNIVKDTDFVLMSIQDTLWRFLAVVGFTTDCIDNVFRDLTQLTWGTSNAAYVTSNDSYFEFVDLGQYFLVVINTIDTNQRLVFRFGSVRTTFLMSPFRDLPPSKWRRVSLNNDPTGDYTFVNMTSYNDNAARWLRQIGVRDSLFYEL